MSGTIPPTGPEIAVTMSVAEWQLVYEAVCTAPLPLFRTQGPAVKLQQQVGAHMARQRANGSLPEAPAEEQP